jgi:hypothetical protein
MEYFAGLDVSVKDTSVCIVDDTGRIVREVKVASEPDALRTVLTNPRYHFKRIGLEAGPLLQWLFSALGEAGLPVICVETRYMRDLTVDSAPVCAKIETVAHDRLEVVLHQPLLDQVWLRERAPDLFRRIRYLTFDNDRERFGRSVMIGHPFEYALPEPRHLPCPVDQGAKGPSCAL